MKAKKKILIVDDEEHIVRMLDINVRTQGYESICAYGGAEALAAAATEQPDIVLLDVMMPEMDGIDVCRRLKSDPRTRAIPVIMVSAKSEEHDKIAGLIGGADDYVTKPFNLQELFLRIEAALRQVEILTGSGGDGGGGSKKSSFTMGSVTLDAGRYQVTCRGNRVDLTLTEFRILHHLIREQGSTVSRSLLIKDIFNMEPEQMGRSIDVHIGNLRRKLESAGSEDCRIETVRGVGYRVVAVP